MDIKKFFSGKQNDRPAEGQPLAQGKLKPGFCCFAVTDDCMLRCKMCQKWKGEEVIRQHPAATLEEWKKAAASLRTVVDKGFEIDIGGGEALMVKWLWELVKYCSGLGFKMAIASNGYLLDKDMAKRIADSGLHSMILSLDSLKPEKHDFFRGVPGVYDRVMRAIELLHKHCPDLHVGICSIIMDANLDEIIPLANWVNSDPRLKSILFMAAMQPNNTPVKEKWYKGGELDLHWPKDTDKAVKVVEELIHLRNKGFLVGNSVQQLMAFQAYYRHPDRFVKIGQCNMNKGVHVSSIGDIFLCYRWDHLGNIKKDDLATALYSEVAENARKKILGCKDNCHFLLNCYYEGDYPFVTEAASANQ